MSYFNDMFRNLYNFISCNKTKAGDSSKPIDNDDNNNNNSKKYVYCPLSSNKYHKSATAHGMKNAIKMTESDAKKKGYIPCQVCY